MDEIFLVIKILERLAATADYRNYPSQRVLNLASNPAAYIPYTNGNVAANFSNILYSSANGFCIIEPFINWFLLIGFPPFSNTFIQTLQKPGSY